MAGFEEVDISERNNRFPAEVLSLHAQSRTWKIQPIIDNILRPLQENPGIDALQSIVTEAERQTGCGLLQDIREVEVTLIASGRVNLKSSP